MSAPAGTALLELSLDPADLAGFAKVPALARLRAGRVKTAPVAMTWHDSPDAALAADGLSLGEVRAGRDTVWRLERMRGDAVSPFPPGAPAPLLAEAALIADLRHALPAPLLAVAAFSGQSRVLPLAAEAPIIVTVLHGALRAVAGERAVCRVALSGPAGELETLALALTGPLRLSVPAASLAAEAYAVAGRDVPPRALGAPLLPTDVGVGAAFAHVAGHLACVMLHWAPDAAAGERSEPVHQMRVALRRLRSALKLFDRAVGCPALAAVTAELRDLSRLLGPARDWDVFCGGTGRAVAAAFPDDRSVSRLLAAAERRRQECYAALRVYLDSSAFRRLGIHLAGAVMVRPWEQVPRIEADPVSDRRAAALSGSLAEFAAHALSRRFKHLLAAGDDLGDLDTEALHAVRIQAKRLRYACEIFAPLFPPRDTGRFIRRSSALQERLGLLNDGAVADGLMAQLAAGGAERRHAIGIVRGFVAAAALGERTGLGRAWKKIRRLSPFWS